MNRYFVGHRISGKEAEEYYRKTASELAKRFGIKDLSKRVAPHITLKPPFESADMEEFQNILEKLAGREEAVPFELEGFGRFDNDSGATIYMEVKENLELQKKAQAIADLLRGYGENRNDLPQELKMHVSIARYLKKGQTGEIWEYLHSSALPKFHTRFDNLCLFQYIPGGWKIYREFPF